MSTRLAVIAAVAAALLVAVGGIIALAFARVPVPDVLQNVAVGSLTLLGGILIPSKGSAADGPSV